MDSENKRSMTLGGVSNSSLKILQPMNLIVFFSFYSPIIVASIITSMSFVKGPIYLGFLLVFVLVRNAIYASYPDHKLFANDDICKTVQYSTNEYGNPAFSAFVFAFTIMYISLPMFSNGAVNYSLFISLVAYFLIDMFIKLYKKCIFNKIDLFLNILIGSLSAFVIVSLMYIGGSGKYLFFNEVSSNKDVCYQPKKQTFKCQVYKDGMLVGNI